MNSFYRRFQEYLKNKYLFGKFEFQIIDRHFVFSRWGHEIILLCSDQTAKITYSKTSFFNPLHLNTLVMKSVVFNLNTLSGEYTVDSKKWGNSKLPLGFIEEVKYLGNNSADFIMGL